MSLDTSTSWGWKYTGVGMQNESMPSEIGFCLIQEHQGSVQLHHESHASWIPEHGNGGDLGS